ncbi:unnamed protein product [Prorocentrum cordatum]|uniref:Holocytochrome c-type synthase n=1 Tax=Prorocentrum cordatum TaxID=2364126 RepID=A0ABN9VVB1_9DINO|nr:unnamed protein product [Polarella glacialis]
MIFRRCARQGGVSSAVEPLASLPRRAGEGVVALRARPARRGAMGSGGSSSGHGQDAFDQGHVESTAHLQHPPPPDEGWLRASQANEAVASQFPWTNKGPHHVPALYRQGYVPIAPGRASNAASGGPCVPFLVHSAYHSFQDALAKAQLRSMEAGETARWLELQRADDLLRFLHRADNSHFSDAEVSSLGRALAATQLAGRGARTEVNGQLSYEAEKVPGSPSACRSALCSSWRSRWRPRVSAAGIRNPARRLPLIRRAARQPSPRRETSERRKGREMAAQPRPSVVEPAGGRRASWPPRRF